MEDEYCGVKWPVPDQSGYRHMCSLPKGHGGTAHFCCEYQEEGDFEGGSLMMGQEDPVDDLDERIAAYFASYVALPLGWEESQKLILTRHQFDLLLGFAATKFDTTVARVRPHARRHFDVTSPPLSEEDS